MKYRYRIWCHDCCGEDEYGCFMGASELSEKVFNSKEEAEAAGEKATDGCCVWEFEVVEDTEGKND